MIHRLKLNVPPYDVPAHRNLTNLDLLNNPTFTNIPIHDLIWVDSFLRDGQFFKLHIWLFSLLLQVAHHFPFEKPIVLDLPVLTARIQSPNTTVLIHSVPDHNISNDKLEVMLALFPNVGADTSPNSGLRVFGASMA
ncbi:hypothetical protein FSOLCH5_006758 [Fusarium solani]